MNVGTFVYDLFNKIIELTTTLYTFLMQELTIGDWTISCWALIGGVGLVALIIASLIKALIPVA